MHDNQRESIEHGAQRESINRKLDVARAVVLMMQDLLSTDAEAEDN